MAARLGHLALYGAALLLLAAILIRILTAPDLNWDAIAYHLPFAGRLAGLCGPDCYTMFYFFEDRFPGFPKSIHYIQAALWRMSGAPQAAGLAGIGLLLGLIAYLRLEFKVSPALAFLAFLAPPLVMIHASSGYVDLPSSALATIAFLSILVAWASPERFASPCFANGRGGFGRLALFVAACALFANGKPQSFVPGALLVAAMGAVLFAGWRRGRLFQSGGELTAAILLLGVGVAAVVWSPLDNLLRFGNPVYPIEFSLGPWRFPGPEPLRMSQSVSISPALADLPSPLRWVMSVFEINAYDGRTTPWTIDQGGVEYTKPSFRMGGYGVGLVVANLLVFLALVLPVRCSGLRPLSTSWTRAAGFLFAGLTLVTAGMPMAHELRYGMSWILGLIGLNLILLSEGIAGAGRSGLELVLRGVTLMGLASTLAVTGGRYVAIHPDQDLASTLRVLGIDRQIAERVHDGNVVCLDNTLPYSYLYAPIFHPGRQYRAVEFGKEGCDVVLSR